MQHKALEKQIALQKCQGRSCNFIRLLNVTCDHTAECAMLLGDLRFRWKRAFFGVRRLKIPGTIEIVSGTYDYAHKTRNRAKFMAITPGVLPPQYDEIAAFGFSFFFHVVNLLISYIHTGSNGSVSFALDCSVCLSGVANSQ